MTKSILSLGLALLLLQGECSAITMPAPPPELPDTLTSFRTKEQINESRRIENELVKEEAQEKENYLKNAEMQMEDDYGMIDGIINNGEKEEKPSIMAELKAAREAREAKPPEKKEKHHDKKVDIDDR